MKVNFVLTGLLQHYHDLSKVIVSLKTTILTTKPLYTKGRFRKKDLHINCSDIMTPKGISNIKRNTVKDRD